MKTTIQKDLLESIARQDLMLNPVGCVNDSSIYQVSAGWQREKLLGDADVIIVQDALEFEGVLKNPNQHTLFIPKDALLTQEIAERILERNVLSKTVFWEV